MEAINSGSFFHYRRDEEDFKKILRDGFSYRYSFEPLGEAIAKAKKKSKRSSGSTTTNYDEIPGIAMPMVCFCDIPIMRAGKHRDTYGKYCIGVDKDMMKEKMKDSLNPVIYVSSDEINKQIEKLIELKKKLPEIDLENNPIADAIKSLKDTKGLVELVTANNSFPYAKELLKLVAKNDKTNSELMQSLQKQYKSFCSDLYNSSLRFIALCKSCEGKNFWEKDPKKEDVCFYDEREWRAFTCDEEPFSWVFDTTFKKFEPQRAAMNKKIENKGKFQKMIKAEDVEKIISHIIVPKDENIPTIINEIMDSPTIFGHELPMEKRQLILSKVTSFERIEKDY